MKKKINKKQLANFSVFKNIFFNMPNVKSMCEKKVLPPAKKFENNSFLSPTLNILLFITDTTGKLCENFVFLLFRGVPLEILF